MAQQRISPERHNSKANGESRGTKWHYGTTRISPESQSSSPGTAMLVQRNRSSNQSARTKSRVMGSNITQPRICSGSQGAIWHG